MLTAERLREVLNYDPETGVFTWIKKTCRKAKIGKVAGTITNAKHGRVFMSVDGQRNYAHRFAWLYVKGEWPPPGSEIDHANGDASDNRWINLRLATKTQNRANSVVYKNNKSGIKGVHWHPQSQKWRAAIRFERRTRHIGLFSNKEDAGRAYMAAAERHFGEFACNGRRA